MYAVRTCWASWNLRRLRHPAVGKLMETSCSFILSAFCSSCQLYISSCCGCVPLCVVGYPHSRHRHGLIPQHTRITVPRLRAHFMKRSIDHRPLVHVLLPKVMSVSVVSYTASRSTKEIDATSFGAWWENDRRSGDGKFLRLAALDQCLDSSLFCCIECCCNFEPVAQHPENHALHQSVQNTLLRCSTCSG